MLNTQVHGDISAGRPLLIAHGLFGSARNWGAIAKRLANARPVITVDMRNHGESPWLPRQRYSDMAADLAEVIAEYGGSADVLGHSMGGKAAMVLALTAPEKVRSVIVADIAPVGYSHSQTPLIDAMQTLDTTGMKMRREADEALSADIPEAAVRAFLLQSLDLKAEPPRWRLNLDVLRADMDAIIGFPDVQGRYDGSAFFLSGGASDYVLPSHHDRIRAQFPQAVFQQIPEAGHWLHAEAPRPFLEAVSAFLEA